MITRKELIQEIEDRAKKLVGIRYQYNILNACRGYKSWKKASLIELKEKYLY